MFGDWRLLLLDIKLYTILWNNLDVELQRIGSVKRFVDELKKLDRNYQEIW